MRGKTEVGPVVVLAPTGRDAESACRLLKEADIDCRVCADYAAFAASIGDGIGAALIAEEALARVDLSGLKRHLDRRPPWSDLPFIILAREASAVRKGLPHLHLTEMLGNVMFLERPLHGLTLVSAVQSALRARRRQLQVRDYLIQQDRAAAALAESEARLRVAMEAGHFGAWEYDVGSGELTASETCKANFGRAADEPFSYEDLVAAVHPEDRTRQQAVVDEAIAARSSFDIDYRVVWPDGSVRWVQMRGRVVDPGDASVRLVGVSQDVTERKTAEQRRDLLLNELNHRVKNTLATVQSIAAQTARGAASVPEFRKAFEARLLAISKTHNLLTESEWQGAELRQILADEAAAYRNGDGAARVRLAGEPVMLPAETALVAGMVFHEMLTNAAKYGALSTSSGHVDIGWHVDRRANGGEVHLTWVESGGPKVEPRKTRGFGSRLIERGLEQEAGGAVAFDFRPEGLRCEMRIPLKGH
ncbi:MAG TPA: HWE histidine kinase domain-containing protein [Beijerinckiaceae bacterium]